MRKISKMDNGDLCSFSQNLSQELERRKLNKQNLNKWEFANDEKALFSGSIKGKPRFSKRKWMFQIKKPDGQISFTTGDAYAPPGKSNVFVNTNVLWIKVRNTWFKSRCGRARLIKEWAEACDTVKEFKDGFDVFFYVDKWNEK